MAGADVHGCPRCELRFSNGAELEDHLIRDHGVALRNPQPELPTYPDPASMRGTITVPVDPAHAGAPAIAVAAALARQGALDVRLVATTLPGLPSAGTDAFLRERCRDAVAAGAPHASWANLGSASPADAIAADIAAVPPVVLCMATRSRRAVGELLLGSVSEAVLRRATVPVLFVGPASDAPPDRYDRVLAAVDGSSLASAAAGAAATLARVLGVELALVEVLAPSTRTTGEIVETVDLRRQAAALPLPIDDYDTLHSVAVAPAIVHKSRERAGTIIAVGTHGRRGLRRVVLGSVALDVVRHAPGPVLVVPETAAHPAATTAETGAAEVTSSTQR